MNEDIESFMDKEVMQEIIEWMKILVSTDTTNPPGNEEVLVDKIIRRLSCKDEDYAKIKHSNGRASLVLSIEGKKKGCLGFMGHLDTVPVNDPVNWVYNPFSAYTENNIMYGRGTTDMCGGIAAMLTVFRHFMNSEEKPPIGLKFYFTAGEEADGLGAVYLRENKLLKDVKGIVICEPTALKLGICESGAIWVKLKSKGKSCHAAMPWEGANAIEKGIEICKTLRTAVVDACESHELLGGNTFSLTMINGGVKTNIIPETAEISIDIRTVPSEKVNNHTIIQNIDYLIHEYNKTLTDSFVDYEILENRQAIAVDKESEYIEAWDKAIELSGKKPEYTGIRYFTDGSLIIPMDKKPFVILGPGEPEDCHITDEKINLTQILEAVNIYSNFIHHFDL